MPEVGIGRMEGHAVAAGYLYRLLSADILLACRIASRL